MTVHTTANPLRVVVLISGSGTNLQAILDSIPEQQIAARVVAVISNNPEALGLQRARQAKVPVEVVNHRDYPDRASYDLALRDAIDRFQPDLVVLAGFMRILTDDFVNHYHGRMINIHPSLLPRYKGLNTHQRALDAGDSLHGCSVHYVTTELDGGPIIVQATVPVHGEDNAESLAQRVHQMEYRIYPLAIRWIAEGHVELNGETVLYDGQPIPAALRQFN